MDVVRWTPSDVTRRSERTIPEELIGVVAVVLDGFGLPGAPVPGAMEWIQRAPCPVIAVEPAPGVPITAAIASADAVVAAADVDGLVARVAQSPRAASVLVDVLRTVERLDVVGGLRVESLAYSTLLASEEFAAWLRSRPPVRPKTFAAPPVRVDRRDDVAHLTLDRPENRNAFSAQMRDALHDALIGCDLDPTIGRVVIDATGPVFSSGGDLGEFGSASDVARAHGIRTLRSVGALVAQMPVTMVVHGGCVGAGAELPAFAPEVVAHPDTTFRLPELEMGLIPGAGGTVSLTRRIGRQRTAELALSGRAMPSAEALRIGLVDAVASGDERRGA